jgi:hypothetical protein
VEEARKCGNNVVSNTQKTGRRNEEKNHVSLKMIDRTVNNFFKEE